MGKTRTDFSACAKAGKILNNYLGIVCRARIDGTPDEVLHFARAEGLARIQEFLDAGMEYPFLHEYSAVIESVPPEIIKELLDKAICSQSDAKSSIFEAMIKPNTCPFEESRGPVKVAKQRCWNCRLLNEAARDMRRGAMEQEKDMDTLIESMKPAPFNRKDTPHTETPAPKPSPFKPKTKKA